MEFGKYSKIVRTAPNVGISSWVLQLRLIAYHQATTRLHTTHLANVLMDIHQHVVQLKRCLVGTLK
jgi:hypothetical protein